MFNRDKGKGKGIEGKKVVRAAQGEWARVRESNDKGLGHGAAKRRPAMMGAGAAKRRPAMMGAHWQPVR